MACIEGDLLKTEVLEKIEAYLATEQAQYTCNPFDEEATRAKAELAHALLAEVRRRYWQHLKMHRCDPAAILNSEPVNPDSVAV